MTYAKKTSVSVAKSKAEVDKTLDRYGASEQLVGESKAQGVAFVAFSLDGRNVKVAIALPKLSEFSEREFRGRMVEATEEWQRKAWEQACRERWRAFVLVLKAKLELIEIGASTVEREFLSDLMLPSGRTVGEEIGAQLDGMTTVPLLQMGTGKQDDP
jgi:hypothetical protein